MEFYELDRDEVGECRSKENARNDEFSTVHEQ
jgi:hypothetical protein